MKRELLLAIFLCLSGITFSQNQDRKVDSLMQILKTAKEDTIKVNALNLISKKQFETGNFDKALVYANDALSLSEKINFKKGVSKAYTWIGVIYAQQSNYPEALKNYLASLKIDEVIGDKQSISHSYTEIGHIFYKLENYDEALKNYLASLKLEDEIGNKKGIVNVYGNIGNTYLAQNNYPEALKIFLTSLKIATKTGDKQCIAFTYGNIGNTYVAQNNYKEALKNYLATLKIEEEIGNKRGMAASYQNLGELYIRLRNYDEAKVYLNKCLLLSQKTRNKYAIMISYRGLSNLDSVVGNFNGAYQYFRLYSEMKDSILNEKSDRQISQLKIQYESDKKDRQIEAMNKDKLLKEIEDRRQKTIKNSIIAGTGALLLIAVLIFFVYRNNRARKESELKHQIADIEMKSLRSQLNPHFIFNAMSTTQSIYGKDKAEGDRFVSEYSNFMRNMLNSSEASEHTIEKEIQLIVGYFNIESEKFEKRPPLNLKVEKGIDRYRVFIPSLLLQPLVENSLKYCLSPNRGNGSIEIIFRKEKNGLVCRVEDIGFERDTYCNILFDNIGDKLPHGASLTAKRLDLFNSKYKYKGGISSEPLHPGTAIVLNIAYCTLE